MFDRILLPTSATEVSDHAARVAFNMVSKHGGHLTIFHVIGVPTRGFSHFVLDIKTNTQVEINEDYIEWVEEEIKNYYSKQLKTAQSYDIRIAVGHPYREILRIDREIKPDLIILGGSTDSNSSYKKNVVGSTVHRVTKSSNCPVLLVNRPAASFWGDISNVVFATDFSKESDIAFHFALNFIKQFNCEFHIFKALDIGFGFLPQDEIDLKIREEMKIIRERYLPNIRTSNCKNYSTNVWEGTPYIETVKYARENHADLIIIAQNYKNSSTESQGLESNIEQIIARSNCPVLSIGRKTVR